MSRLVRDQDRAIKRARVKHRFKYKSPSSAAPYAKDKIVFMDIDSDDVQEPDADSDTALLKGSLQTYCRVFHCLFQEFSDYLEQVCIDVEIKIDLIIIDLRHNMCYELGRQSFYYASLSEDYIAERVEMNGKYVKLGFHDHMMCSAVQVLS